MRLPELKHSYGWSFITRFEAGPRREITLFILWSDDGRDRSAHSIVPVRFGGIENFEEVKAFFNRIATSQNCVENIDRFGYDSFQNSKPGHLFFQIRFDRTGESIVIRCSDISEDNS